jgi:phosphate:Na+ symporter
MRRILQILTINPFVGILVGALVTTVLQSSSATTVMVIGFVSAGLMSLRQAIGVIMGANIGTTITAWLVSIKISEFAFPIAFVGFILLFFISNQKVKHIGQVIFGFGLLFIGLNVMSDAMKPLAKSTEVMQLMLAVADKPLLGVGIGAGVTAVVQSSSAAIAVVQKLATSLTPEGLPLISLTAAIPIVLGSNIGTTMTAQLASIGASRSAKRAAMVHTIFNVGGSIIFLFLLKPSADLVRLMMGGEPAAAQMDMAIADFHTMFNVVCTILFLPFVKVLEKIVCWLLKGKEDDGASALAHIDDKVLHTPAIAMDLAVSELVRMGKITRDLIETAKKCLLTRDPVMHAEAFKLEDTTDTLKNEIIAYLSRILSIGALTDKQSVRLTGLMHMAHDIERIGDNGKNIAKISEHMVNEKVVMSDSAMEELSSAFDDILSIFDETIQAYEKEDMDAARIVIEREDDIDDLEARLRARHIERLNSGACKPDTAIAFVELIHYIERMSDSCKNIAESVLDDLSHKLGGIYDKTEKAGS